MTKTFKLENLCCANCAAKIERSLNKLPGVKSAAVNFMTTKLILDLDEGNNEDVMASVEKTVKKIERNVVLKAL